MDNTSLRTFIGSVVCIDLVGYSKLTVDQQIAVKNRFNARLMKALQRVSTTDRVTLDTGDGALIGFLGDPEECFAVVLSIRDALDAGSVRIGIHLGSVKLLPGVSGDVRLVGDTTHIAERITSLAQPGQIAVSRAFHAMVSRLSDKHEAQFRNEGVRTDKQGQEHELFVVDALPPRRAGKPVVIAVASIAVVAAIGTGTWFAMRRGAAAQGPDIAAKGEVASVLAAKPQSPPPIESKPPAVEVKPPAVEVKPPAVESKREPPPAPRNEPAPPEPKRSQPARSAPRATPPAEPRPPSSSPGGTPTESRKFFSGLWSGARDAARSVGSGASSVYSTAKEKTVGTTQPAATASPSPPPTVMSRAATYFPQEATSQGISSGKVHARLDIDATGGVYRVTILSSDPPGVFDREATRSLLLWRFNAGTDARTYEAEVDFRH